MTELHITRGLPGSGKSTFAHAWVSEDPSHRANITRDDLRTMLHNGVWSQATEPTVITSRNILVATLLRRGISVIVSDTNLPNSVVRDLMNIAASESATVVIQDFTNVSVEDCLYRNNLREDAVPDEVIGSMYRRYLAGKPYPLPTPPLTLRAPLAGEPYVPVPNTSKAILVDIDGTLANHNGRDPYDESRVLQDLPIKPVVDAVRLFHREGYEVIFMSGRSDGCYEETRIWLYRALGYWVYDSSLHMRKAGDARRDDIVKLELFNKYVRSQYDIRAVFDDRNSVVKMWRSLGLTVFQVAEGDF